MTESRPRPKAEPFSETADVETASDDYARRFEGPTGEWFLRVQERAVFSLLNAPPGADLLDVGGGHGQLAGPLCRAGYKVTVLGSRESCRKRIGPLTDSATCRFVVGDVLALPCDDRSYDTVLCFRLLPHCRQWPRLVAELCRAAAGSVIVDYPTTRSLNRLAPLFFGAKQRIEKNTRTWRQFRDSEVTAAFAEQGFRPAGRIGQFFLPMALHRAMGCHRVSQALEGCARLPGLTAAFGSPVIVKMVRS